MAPYRVEGKAFPAAVPWAARAVAARRVGGARLRGLGLVVAPLPLKCRSKDRN